MRFTVLATGIRAAALMGSGSPATAGSDIRLVAQGEYGGKETAGHQIVPTAAALPTGHGDVAIEKLVILYAGTHADGRYSMQVLPASHRGRCD